MFSLVTLMTYQKLYPLPVLRTESVGVAGAAGRNQCHVQPRLTSGPDSEPVSSPKTHKNIHVLNAAYSYNSDIETSIYTCTLLAT